MGEFLEKVKGAFIRPETEEEESKRDSILKDITGTNESSSEEIVEGIKDETPEEKAAREQKLAEELNKKALNDLTDKHETEEGGEADKEFIDSLIEPQPEPKTAPEPTDSTKELMSKAVDLMGQLIEKTEAESKAKAAAQARSLEVPDFLVEARMKPKKVYDNLGDVAFEADRTGQASEELESYIFQTLDTNPALCEKIVAQYFDDYLASRPDLIDTIVACNFEDYLKRNPEDIDKAERVIVRVSNANINVALRFVDSVSGTRFETKAEATASIQEHVKYGANPDDIIKKEYFWKDDPDRVLTEAEVRDYIANFPGDKKKLKKKLQYEDKPLKDGKKKGKKSS